MAVLKDEVKGIVAAKYLKCDSPRSPTSFSMSFASGTKYWYTSKEDSFVPPAIISNGELMPYVSGCTSPS